MPCKLCGTIGVSFRTCNCPGAQEARYQSWKNKGKGSDEEYYGQSIETAISLSDSVIEDLEDDLKEIRSKTRDSYEEKEILRAITVSKLVEDKLEKKRHEDKATSIIVRRISN